MKILVVGGGGREHAIVRKLKENPAVTALYCLPGNGGIARDAVCVPIAATDLEGILDFARKTGIDYVGGVPDSGTPHAIGYANESGKHFARAFIKYTPTWARRAPLR